MTIPAVDLHCHLDLYPNPALAAARIKASGAYVLSVTTTPKAWRGTVALAQGCPRIKTALGLHPQIAHERIGELPLFDALLPETRYIGEVGLDGSPQHKPFWGAQTAVFEHVLASAARAGGRVITLHSRRATTEVLNALERHPDAGVPILHWFTGTKAELHRAIAMGCWFSVGPAMVQSKRGRDLVSVMPRDRVVTETDGPFATLDKKALEPSEVGIALDALAECWSIDADDAASTVLASFKRLVAMNLGGGSGG